jgi:hypothetical protein
MDKITQYNEQIEKIMSIFPEYFVDKNTSEAKQQLIKIATERLQHLAKMIYNDGYYDGKSSKN